MNHTSILNPRSNLNPTNYEQEALHYHFALGPANDAASLTPASLKGSQQGWKAHEHWYVGDGLACQGTELGSKGSKHRSRSKGRVPLTKRKNLNRRELDRMNGVETQRSLPSAPSDKDEGFEDLWMTCLGCKVKALMAAVPP